jgi:GT2 family glycosyltransferase
VRCGAVSVARATVSVVVPNWNGRAWLRLCLEGIRAQDSSALEVIVVDNASDDGSLEYLRSEFPYVRLIPLGRNTGFAYAANRGVDAARGEFVALVNTDVVLGPHWLARMAAALGRHPKAAAVACKMLVLDEPARIYDAGDVLRRDGVCEQRGRFAFDDGRWDEPGEVFGACAGAALYRRAAILSVGGFDERYFAYLEDVDLALRLRLAGWLCRYEPVVAYHAGEQSSDRLPGGHMYLVERNTLALVAKAFPAPWLPLVVYRQASWLWHALRQRRLSWHLRGAAAALRLLPAALRERRRLRRQALVPVEIAVPARPIRGPRAGGHPAQIAGTGHTASASGLSANRRSGQELARARDPMAMQHEARKDA